MRFLRTATSSWRRKAALLLLLLLVPAAAVCPAVAPLPAETACEEDLHPGAEAPPALSSEEANVLRGDLLGILEVYQEIAAAQGFGAASTATVSALDVLSIMADQDFAVFVGASPAIEAWRRAVDELAAAVSRGRSGSATPTSVGFPSAAYSTLCGSERNNTEVVFAAKVALQAARLVWSAASRGCDQVVVALGEGGNTSLGCIVADAVLFAAEAVLEDLIFCDDNIDSAEIEGAYERLDHLHGDVEVLQEHVDEIWERQIEENVFHRRALVSLFLPTAHGGRLESVRDIVQEWITQAAAAGMDVSEAEEKFQEGLEHFDNNEYKSAYKKFSKAYRELTEGDDDHDDGESGKGQDGYFSG